MCVCACACACACACVCVCVYVWKEREVYNMCGEKESIIKSLAGLGTIIFFVYNNLANGKDI